MGKLSRIRKTVGGLFLVALMGVQSAVAAGNQRRFIGQRARVITFKTEYTAMQVINLLKKIIASLKTGGEISVLTHKSQRDSLLKLIIKEKAELDELHSLIQTMYLGEKESKGPMTKWLEEMNESIDDAATTLNWVISSISSFEKNMKLIRESGYPKALHKERSRIYSLSVSFTKTSSLLLNIVKGRYKGEPDSRRKWIKDELIKQLRTLRKDTDERLRLINERYGDERSPIILKRIGSWLEVEIKSLEENDNAFGDIEDGRGDEEQYLSYMNTETKTLEKEIAMLNEAIKSLDMLSAGLYAGRLKWNDFDRALSSLQDVSEDRASSQIVLPPSELIGIIKEITRLRRDLKELVEQLEEINKKLLEEDVEFNRLYSEYAKNNLKVLKAYAAAFTAFEDEIDRVETDSEGDVSAYLISDKLSNLRRSIDGLLFYLMPRVNEGNIQSIIKKLSELKDIIKKGEKNGTVPQTDLYKMRKLAEDTVNALNQLADNASKGTKSFK